MKDKREPERDKLESAVAEQDGTQKTGKRISRRAFLKGTAAAVTATAAATACQNVPQTETAAVETPLPTLVQYPEIQYPPSVAPSSERLRFFSPQEARTVEALTARILPGTPDDPGAREAGVVIYIDYLLSLEEGFGERTYREPPYVRTYEGDQPPAEQDAGGFPTLWVPASEIKRYGYQHLLSPREVYRIALPLIDRYCRDTYGGPFVELSEADQDSLIGDLYNNRVTGFEQFSPSAFFHVLRRHTDEGMFSDPAYGGNRDLVGWSLIGYPGAQRAYTPDEILAENPVPRRPQGLADMRHFYPGQNSGPGVILPLRGSEPEHRDLEGGQR
jgi:gluconate 2-dehydrogenase gamma chain